MPHSREAESAAQQKCGTEEQGVQQALVSISGVTSPADLLIPAIKGDYEEVK